MVPVNPGIDPQGIPSPSPDDPPISADFALLPAIDLRGGRVVRLRQGDFDKETVYGDDPIEVAMAFAASGARWLHVVDLDGARVGSPQQTALIAGIVSAVSGRMRVQIGGGLRDRASVEGVLATSAARAVLGTVVLDDPAFAGRLVETHGAERLVVALDVRDGLAIGSGWLAGAPGLPVVEALSRIADQGIRTFAVTAIERDGLLDGPDLDLLARLIALGRGSIIASGGISSTADVLAARRIGCAGAIVGRAIYEGRLDLAGTLEALRSDQTV
jgi:phosphoribosylformimino-5-aminoimidazole carboxamide ribotide isomerase